MQTYTRRGWLLVAVCLFVAGCKGGTIPVVGTKAGGSQPGIETKTGGLVEAAKLCDDYKSGEATADGHFKGKDIQVKGSFLNLREDRNTKTKFVVLKGSAHGGGTRNVRCYLAPEANDEAEKLKAGAEVTLHGTCEGKMPGSGDSFDILMKNCKLVKGGMREVH